MFPVHRLRRLRGSEGIRRLVRETRVTADDLVLPLFVTEGRADIEPIESMPGVYRLSVPALRSVCGGAAAPIAPELNRLADALRRVPAVLVFGVTDAKDDEFSRAWSPDGPVQEAVKVLRNGCPQLCVITDVCLCAYGPDGHCGPVKKTSSSARSADQVTVDNDSALEYLARIAVSHAAAGADVVAPSAMMDGQVQAIRSALDEAGFTNVAVLSYAAKYASAFYGPFREAAGSAPRAGHRRSYQLDPANWRQALSEVERDIEEGADLVMVKPALAYLDVIARVRRHTSVPLLAYNVSGEYAMAKAAAAAGVGNERALVEEILLAIKRAGADAIVTYHAVEVLEWLR